MRLELRAVCAPTPANDTVVRSVRVSTKNSGGHDHPQPNLAEQDDFANRLRNARRARAPLNSRGVPFRIQFASVKR